MEGAPGLERSRRLKAFELQRKRRSPIDWRGGIEDGRAADMVADMPVGGSDRGRRDDGVQGQSGRWLLSWLARPAVRRSEGCFNKGLRSHIDLVEGALFIGLRVNVEKREALNIPTARAGSLARSPLHFLFIDPPPARHRHDAMRMHDAACCGIVENAQPFVFGRGRVRKLHRPIHSQKNTLKRAIAMTPSPSAHSR